MIYLIFLVLFSIGFIVSAYRYFRPANPDSTDYAGVIDEYRTLSKRNSILSAALFFLLILQEIGELTGL